MRISDEITAYILHMLETADSGEAELRRNELAEELGCVPSQINYVLTSRFTPEQGYVVESRRGGGGYIRIRRVKLGRGTTLLMHTVNSIGNALDPSTARVILENLAYQQAVSAEAARLIAAAVSDQSLHGVPAGQRDRLRASLFKQMLTTLIS